MSPRKPLAPIHLEKWIFPLSTGITLVILSSIYTGANRILRFLIVSIVDKSSDDKSNFGSFFEKQ